MQTQGLIEKILSNGAGVDQNGRTGFGLLPGEQVVWPEERGKLRILEPSPERIKARCGLAGRCGACVFHHASDGFVAGWKETQVADALGQYGISAEFEPIGISAAQTRRRAKIAARRSKSGAVLGFYGRASHHIVPIEGCQILAPEIMESLTALKTFTQTVCSRRQTLAMTVTRCDAGLDLSVEAEGGEPPSAQAIQKIAPVLANAGILRLVWAGETLFQHARPVLTIGPAQVDLPAGAFLQATAEAERDMQNEVLRHLDKARHVCDLFCGIGTFALPLAQNRPVSAFEYGDAMVKALQIAAERTPKLRPIQAQKRDLFKNPVTAQELASFDGAVIDPPRSGAEAQIHQICGSNLERLVYVSCSPRSFAKDAYALVQSGFQITSLRVIDQFRWSPHVELVAAFQRV